MSSSNVASVSLAERDSDFERSLIGGAMAAAKPDEAEQTRIVLFRMECAFTAPIAELLLATPGVSIAAIVLARTSPAAPACDSSWTGQLALQEGVPVIDLSERGALRSGTFLSTVATFAPDLIVVACFPWRLPPAVFSLPRIGSVNIHPSLLPDGRGPEPIFWAFRRHLESTGVTLHVIDEGLDTGPIIDRRRVAIPSDATMLTLERSLAHIGAEMLREFLADPSSLASASPQPAGAGRPAPFPGAGDLLVTTEWQAAAAARFINGVSPVYGPVEVLVLATGQRLAVEAVLGIEAPTPTTSAVVLRGDRAWIEFANGRLHCRLRSTRQQLTFGR